MFSQLLTRAGIAVSVAGHVLFLVWVIFFAGAHPYEPRPVEAIAVDIVTPDEIPQPAKEEPKPAEEKPKLPDQLTLPDMEKAKPPEEKPPEQKPPEEKSATEKPPEEKTKPAEPPKQEAAAPPPAAPSPPSPSPPPPQTQAPPETPPQPPQQQAATTPPPQQPTPSPQQAVPRAEPDITERFGMMFSLPNVPGGGSGDFDAQATQAAEVSANDIAKLRAHLKACTPLPKDVSPSDNIQFVLRVSFTPDGHLATDPMLIKGPRPSPKVLALLQGAISGLQSCQPYTMLPADKYNEWRNVDLTFTPRDFGGG